MGFPRKPGRESIILNIIIIMYLPETYKELVRRSGIHAVQLLWNSFEYLKELKGEILEVPTVHNMFEKTYGRISLFAIEV